MVLNLQYQLQTGQLTELKYSKNGSELRKLGYGYDVFGNLKQQKLNTNQSQEDYSYDELHRLVQSIRSGAATGMVNYGFDAVGNFTKKTDFSTSAANAYSYSGGTCGGGANAVKSIALAAGGSRTYCYDANGNLISDNAGLSLKYDHMGMTTVAQRGALRDDFRYGADGMRTRSWGSDGSRIYLPGYEHRIDTNETKVYVGDYAVITNGSAGRKVEYLLKDRLGSVDAIASNSGTITETRGYDAFGKPRSGTWADLTPPKLGSTNVTPKGFTQHEHLNQLELIHMNGRLFDYNVGRFTGVDPVIQFPLNSQSLNPYSYILNNPLSGTDPTGYTACNDVSTSEAGSGSCTYTTSDGKDHDVDYKVGKNGKVSVSTSMSSFKAIAADNMQRGENGGAAPKGVTDAGRKEAAAAASQKGVASTSSQMGSAAGASPASRFFPDSLKKVKFSGNGAGDSDDLPPPPHTLTEPEGLTALKAMYPEIQEEMDKAWEKSFESYFRKEHLALAFERPGGGEIKFIRKSADWRWYPSGWGYKQISLSGPELEKLMEAAGIPFDWNVVVAFHTHPFNQCWGIGCFFDSDVGPGKGPSGADGLWPKAWPNTYHVVREINEAEFSDKNRAYKDYHYGPLAL